MTIQSFLVGITAAIIAIAGPSIFIIDAATSFGFSQAETISWLFSVYVIGGVLSFILTFKYKIPLVGAHSLTGAAFLAGSAMDFTLQELTASYIVTGVILVLVGFTGVFKKIIYFIPNQLIEAMLAGLILNYVLKSVAGMEELPIVGVLCLIGFFVTPLISEKIPRFFGSLVLGFIGLLIFYPLSSNGLEITYVLPELVNPDFSLLNVFSLSLPLALLILSGDSLVALSALRRNQFEPPVTQTIVSTGIATTIAGLFGGHAASVGGMTTTLCSSEEAGKIEKRYYSAIVASIVIALFGILSPFAVSYINYLPAAFISIIAGFSLLTILTDTLHSSFQNRDYYFPATLTFIISLSGINFFQVSAPVWALGVGLLSMKVVEGIDGKNRQAKSSVDFEN